MNQLELYIINNPGVTMQQLLLADSGRSANATVQAVCRLVAKKKVVKMCGFDRKYEYYPRIKNRPI